jgi:hypothetical protein
MQSVITCPYCGKLNDYYAHTCVNPDCQRDILQVYRPPIQPNQIPSPIPVQPPGELTPTAPVSAPNTFKVSTWVLIGVGILFSPTVIGLIICGVIAYFSYKAPNKNWPFS